MPIRYKCEECGATLKIKDELAGRPGKCPKCRTAFRVPVPERSGAQGVLEAERQAYHQLTEELSRPTATTDPTERPKKVEGYFRAGPTVASNIASELLSQTGKKSQRGGDWRAALKKPFTPTKATQAYHEYLRYYVGKVIVVAACCVLIVAGAWWVGTHLWGPSSDHPELGTVNGVVTLNEAPLVRATVTFMPKRDPRSSEPAGSASFGRTDENGLYELQYVKDVPGAVLGKHRVEITPSTSSRVLLPSIYNVNSQLEAEVKKGKNVHHFRLKTAL